MPPDSPMVRSYPPPSSSHRSPVATGRPTRRPSPWRRRCVILAPLLAAVAGCGSSSKGDRVPVFPASGRVVFDGRSLDGAYLVLHPQDAKDNVAPRPHAKLASDGSFQLTSYETNDGAPAGGYTATVELRPLVKNGGDYAPGPNVLPTKYGIAASSPLKVQIASGANTLGDLQIQK